MHRAIFRDGRLISRLCERFAYIPRSDTSTENRFRFLRGGVARPSKLFPIADRSQDASRKYALLWFELKGQRGKRRASMGFGLMPRVGPYAEVLHRDCKNAGDERDIDAKCSDEN
jgi:hypothetical protein